MKILIFVLFTVLTSSLGATESTIDDQDEYFPQRLSASELLTACSSSSLTYTGRRRNRYCHGFVSGVEEGIRLYGQHTEVKSLSTFCVPPGLSSRQLANAYVKYATSDNADMSKPAAGVVVAALKRAFPC